MRVNQEKKQAEMEVRDINYILPAYIKSYLFFSRNEDPERIIFPMFPSVRHPRKDTMIPIEYVPVESPAVKEIIEDASNVPEVTPEQEAELDKRDDEIKRLKEEIARLQEQVPVIDEEAISATDGVVTTLPAKDSTDAADDSPAKKAFGSTAGSSFQPPAGRIPKQPPGGALPPGTHLDGMGPRDKADIIRIAKDLREKPGAEDEDEALEKPYEKVIKRDETGKPVIEEKPDAPSGQ